MFINYLIEKCTVKHWNSRHLILQALGNYVSRYTAQTMGLNRRLWNFIRVKRIFSKSCWSVLGYMHPRTEWVRGLSCRGKTARTSFWPKLSSLWVELTFYTPSLPWCRVQRQIYGYLSNSEVCYNLMFFWPCIMNWLYINYQLDAPIIIYS